MGHASTQLQHACHGLTLPLLVLLVARFSNVTFQTLKGHAAVVLMDEHNYRLKKTNSSNRAGSDKETPQPFSTLVCAGSALAQG